MLKGDGGFKILQKEIGGIQICVEIFQKKLLKYIFGGLSVHLEQKKLRKKFLIFFIFHRGDPYDLFSKKSP